MSNVCLRLSSAGPLSFPIVSTFALYPTRAHGGCGARSSHHIQDLPATRYIMSRAAQLTYIKAARAERPDPGREQWLRSCRTMLRVSRSRGRLGKEMGERRSADMHTKSTIMSGVFNSSRRTVDGEVTFLLPGRHSNRIGRRENLVYFGRGCCENARPATAKHLAQFMCGAQICIRIQHWRY